MLKIVETADGSKTIYNEEVDELYHSRNGALQESIHVFINAGLKYFLSQNMATEAGILEVGFGTGLNFLLSAQHCSQNQIKLSYTGIEAYPLSPEMISQTGYGQYISPALWESFIAAYPLSLKQAVDIDPLTQLTTAHHKLLEFTSAHLFDVIYFDAFASSKQPEMWTDEAITQTINFLKPGGIFVTYAITGNLKRLLKSLGLKIEKVPGAAGKREMLRGTNKF